MIRTTRTLLALSILVIILAACSTTVGAPEPSAPAPTAPTQPSAAPSDVPEPSAPAPTAPTQPSAAPSDAPDAPDAPRQLAGTITVVQDVSVGGPGGSIAEALAAASTEPNLVNGVIFKDVDGTIYLADSLTDAAAPSFGDPILEVLNYYEGGSEWDMQYADVIGLQEANGVLFREGAQVYGVVAP